jgi:uncharacterized protein DUF1629
MYYRLAIDEVAANVYLARESNEFITLIEGTRLPDDTPVPFEFSMSVDEGLDENDEDVTEEPRMYAFFPEPCVMHNKFVTALRKAGVDNVQTFPAVITEEESGRNFKGYVAANVVGLVSCANVAESKSHPFADVYVFEDLVIDPKKTHGLLLFRLAESPTEIIVHETVAKAIEAGNFEGVVLEPLSEASRG